tara:strand:- start:51 stop:224 length:174 start_codon:yes stop_codon:yes gene_type:complete
VKKRSSHPHLGSGLKDTNRKLTKWAMTSPAASPSNTLGAPLVPRGHGNEPVQGTVTS